MNRNLLVGPVLSLKALQHEACLDSDSYIAHTLYIKVNGTVISRFKFTELIPDASEGDISKHETLTM